MPISIKVLLRENKANSKKQFTQDSFGETVFLWSGLLLRVVLGIIMILRNKNKGEQDEETIQLYDIFSR